MSRSACAPTLFVPAAQKGASSYLASLLATHPQVLRPLRGSHYKEPGGYINAVYYRQPLSKRASRYAYFRNDEGLVSLDATVTYASESRMPAMRAALDAPNAKVVFALREPVDRSFSDYRFCYRPYFQDGDIDWDQATQDPLPTYDTCFAKARALLARNDTAASDVAGIDAYYGLACAKLYLRRKDPYGLIRKSLYVYQVLHYVQVYGADSVTAVSSEQLRKDAAAVGDRVAAFAGLCTSFKFDAIEPVHVTPIRPKEAHFWSKEGYAKLRDWFEPYNKRLYAVLGISEADLGWERRDMPDFRRGPS